MKKTEGINPQEEDGRYYLEMIKDICEKNKIPLLTVIFPYLKPMIEYAPWQKDEYQIICKVVKDLKIPYHNLYDLYEQLSKEKFPLRDNDKDDVHPSKETQRIIAKNLHNILDNSFNKD